MKLSKGGDTIGRIIIVELEEQDSHTFNDIVAYIQSHSEFEKWELDSEPVLSFPGLEINLNRRKVISNGKEAELTAKEYDILCLLATNRGRVLTYSQIYEMVWGDFSAGNERGTVGYHIRNLRKKLFDTAPPYHFVIESVREVGYRFESNSQ